MTVTWSHSALNAFETCPKRYQLTRVTKQAAELPNDATIWGNKVHKGLEEYAKRKTPLPEEISHFKRYVDKIQSYKGKQIVEEKIALTKSLRPTTWMAKDVWVRGVIDIGVIGSDTAFLLDWKTGKYRPDNNQLMLFAALAFATYPWIKNVVTGFVWLTAKKFDKEKFSKEQVTDLWGEFHPRVERLEEAYKQDKWIAKPSGLCRKWCPVGKSLCEFCGD